MENVLVLSSKLLAQLFLILIMLCVLEYVLMIIELQVLGRKDNGLVLKKQL